METLVHVKDIVQKARPKLRRPDAEAKRGSISPSGGRHGAFRSPGGSELARRPSPKPSKAFCNDSGAAYGGQSHRTWRLTASPLSPASAINIQTVATSAWK